MDAPASSIEARVALALGRMGTGCLSAVASLILIYKIFSRYHRQHQSASRNVNTYHRLVLGLACMDVLFSLGSASAPFALPASAGRGIFGLHGTTATCTVQGASVQLVIAIVLYTAALNTYFMLKIRYNVSDAVMSRRYEPWMHAVPIMFAIASISIGIALELFNPLPMLDLGCWIVPYPVGCDAQPETCLRGQRLYKHASSWAYHAWPLAIAWLFAAFVAVLVNSVLIYTTIRHQERRNERYTLPVDTAHPPNANGGSSSGSGSPHDWALGTVAQRQGNHCTPSSQAPQDAIEAESHSVGQTMTADRTSESDSDSSDWTSHDRNCTSSSMAAPGDQAYIAEFDFDNDTASRNSESNTAGTMIPVAAAVASTAASTTKHKVKTSQVAAQQSTLYCCATLLPAIVLVIPWLGTTLLGVTQQCQLVFAFLLQYLLATQGIFYLFIYIRPAYRRLRQHTPDASHIHCLVVCLFSNDPKHW